MKRSSFIPSVILLSGLLVLAGCFTGKGAYQRGDYLTACEQAIDALRSKPENKDAQEALTNAYPLAHQVSLRDINNIVAAKDYINFDRAINLYDKLNKIADEIYHCPAALRLIPNPIEYRNERRETIDAFLPACYAAGEKALSYGTVDQARVALNYFSKVNAYSPGYQDVLNKIAQANYESTLRVLIVSPMLPQRYTLDANFFYERLLVDISKRSFTRLVRFYTPEEAAATGMNNPHQFLVLDFTDFTVGNSHETTTVIDCRKDDITIGTTTMPDGTKQPVNGSVKAKLTVNRMELLSQGVLDIRLTDAATGRVLDRRNMTGTFTWINEWGFFNGDERALSKEQLAITENRQLPAPPAQVLFSGFASPLYAKASEYIMKSY